MIGYKYDYFRYLGFFSAKIEDIFTFIPSRLVLITLPLVSYINNWIENKINNYDDSEVIETDSVPLDD